MQSNEGQGQGRMNKLLKPDSKLLGNQIKRNQNPNLTGPNLMKPSDQ